MSSGFMLAMSPWMTWPTFSSTVIFLSSADTFSSRAASLSNGHFGEGQIAGCTSALFAGGVAVTGAGVSFPASLHPRINRKGTSAATARYLERTRDMEGDIGTPVFERAQPMLSAAEIRDARARCGRLIDGFGLRSQTRRRLGGIARTTRDRNQRIRGTAFVGGGAPGWPAAISPPRNRGGRFSTHVLAAREPGPAGLAEATIPPV